MTRLASLVPKIRSKNAGPFWLTIDIFCGSSDVFSKVEAELASSVVAERLKVSADTLKRYNIADLNVVKFSLPRPVIQGSVRDRDMHGASFAELLADLEI